MTVVSPARRRSEAQASCKPQAARHFMTAFTYRIDPSCMCIHTQAFVIAYDWSVETKVEAGLAHLVEEQTDFLKHKWKALWSKKSMFVIVFAIWWLANFETFSCFVMFYVCLSCRYCLQAIYLQHEKYHITILQLCLELLKVLHHLLSTVCWIVTWNSDLWNVPKPPLDRGHSTKWWPYKVPADCHGHRREVREDPGEPKKQLTGLDTDDRFANL